MYVTRECCSIRINIYISICIIYHYLIYDWQRFKNQIMNYKLCVDMSIFLFNCDELFLFNVLSRDSAESGWLCKKENI